MKRLIGAVWVILLGFALQTLMAGSAHAIPAFARQYNTECKTCHTIFPERNEFGEAFEKNGFIWPGKKPPKQAAQKNEALLLSGIPSLAPVGFLGNHEAVYNKDKKQKLNMFGTSEFEMFTAGSLQDKAGWFAEYSFTEGETGEIYIKFKDPFNIPVYVKAGKFKPTLNLWKSNNRATIEKMGYIQQKVGGSSFKINSERNGVEIDKMFGPRVYAAVGLLNSDVTTDAGGEPTRSSNDLYAHVQARLSGTDYEGNEPEVSLTSDSIMDFLTITVGGFLYNGSSLDNNDFYKAGLEAEVLYKSLKVRVGMTKGKDDDPNNDGSGSLKSTSLLAQASYMAAPNTMVVARLESLDNGDAKTTIIAPAVVHSILQSVKVGAEYVHKKEGSAKEDEVIAHIMYAF